MSGSVWYLYCLAPGPLSSRIPAAGVEDGAAVLSLAFGRMIAVVSELSSDGFCGPGSEDRLQDLAWLSPRALRHEAVIEEVMGESPVLPARFATLFRSLDSLGGFLRDRESAIAGFFEKMGWQREWAVKGLLERRLTVERGAAGVDAGAPGRRYFQKRRTEDERREQFRLWLKDTCQKAAGELLQHAGDFRERKVIGQPEQPGSELLLNWAFALRPEAEPAFREVLGRLNADHAGRGLHFVMTGPWPPYSFVPRVEWAGSPAKSESGSLAQP
jgi:gas vesicle protein GvpL/GvpF